MRHEFGFCSGPCAGFVTRAGVPPAGRDGGGVPRGPHHPADRSRRRGDAGGRGGGPLRGGGALAREVRAARVAARRHQPRAHRAWTCSPSSTATPATSATTGSTSSGRAWCGPSFPVSRHADRARGVPRRGGRGGGQARAAASGPLPLEAIDEILLLMSWFRAHPEALRRTTPLRRVGRLSDSPGPVPPRASASEDGPPATLTVNAFQISRLAICIFVAPHLPDLPSVARSAQPFTRLREVICSTNPLGRRPRRPRRLDAVGRPAALRRSLVRHHSLRRVHEVRQPRLRSLRHQRAKRRRGGLRRRATLGLTRAIALVGNVAYAQPGLEIGAPLIGGLSVGQSSALLYDAALRLRVPLGMGGLPITPFVQGGRRLARQSFDIGPASTHSTNFAYNVGAGADVALGSAFRPAADGQGLHREVRCAEATGLNVDTKTTHNFTVSAGLRLGL